MEMYQSPCHNYLEPITSIITIIPEIVLVFMHQLAQLKQVIELSATEGYTFRTIFHKQINTNSSYPCFKKLVKIYIQNNNLDNLRLNYCNIVSAIKAYIFNIFSTLLILYLIYYLSYTYFAILIVNIMYYVYTILYCIVYIGIVTHVKYIS